MKNNKLIFPVALLFSIVINGCIPAPDVEKSPASHPTIMAIQSTTTIENAISPSPLPDLAKTDSDFPSQTAELPTTATPGITLTADVQTPTDSPQLDLPAPGIITNCLAIKPGSVSELGGSGYIAMEKTLAINSSYLNMTTGERISLPEDWDSSAWNISPDELWLTKFEGTDLLVMSTDGDVKNKIPLSNRWGGWLGNEDLQFYRLLKSENKYSLVVVNFISSQQQEFLPDYPEIYFYISNFPKTYYFPIERYDQTLTRVVYPYILMGDKGEIEEGFRLWDMNNKRVLASMPAIIGFSGPEWAPNDQKFVVHGLPDFPEGYPELYSISRDGEITQLTNMVDYHGAFRDNSYRWSPDGRYLAFWLLIGEPRTENLAVIDTVNRKLVNYCIPGAPLLGENAPIWSSDSKQLAVASYDVDKKKQAVVVDVTQGIAMQIGEDLRPVYWLKSIPAVWFTP